ncbi:(2Fe-2S)-binding protein [Roseateles flavus]|uniref:(2Fe-2S)-binding protein n=1 Tax=Roseateles flavus TaxID=3149041 RepID=A0ABV0GKV5_9BURK
MFKQLNSEADEAQRIKLVVNEQEVVVSAGQTLAVALLSSPCSLGKRTPFRRSAVSGQPRAPLCLMGTCFECLVELDGQPNVQACMVTVAPGMRVRLQAGARHIEVSA